MSLELRETEIDNRLVWALVKKTGLRFSTVRNLLVNGWAYEEELIQVPRWVHPVYRLKEIK